MAADQSVPRRLEVVTGAASGPRLVVPGGFRRRRRFGSRNVLPTTASREGRVLQNQTCQAKWGAPGSALRGRRGSPRASAARLCDLYGTAPPHQWREVYIKGVPDDCFGHWDNLTACLAQRTKFKDTVQVKCAYPSY